MGALRSGVLVDHPPELAAAVAEVDRFQISFDVALVTQGVPSRETFEMRRRPAPWVLVTAWDHGVRDLATAQP